MENLKARRVWTHCKKVEDKVKAPALGLGRTKPIAYEEAKANAAAGKGGSPYYGVVFPKKVAVEREKEYFEYIGLDIDVDSTGAKENATLEIPAPVLDFLKTHPTHVHFSPNGEGIHILYKLSPLTQRYLVKAGLNQAAVSVGRGDLFDGDVRFRNCFLIFTENPHPMSTKNPSTINLISYEGLLNVIPSVLKKEGAPHLMASKATDTRSRAKSDNAFSDSGAADPENSTSSSIDDVAPSGVTNNGGGKKPALSVRVPALSAFEEAIREVPASFNPKAQKACANLPHYQPRTPYDYWVLVCSICAHTYILYRLNGRDADADRVFQLFHEWSAKDTAGYKGEEDVRIKFKDLVGSTTRKMKSGESLSTFGTLKALAGNCVIEFPDMVMRGKKVIPDTLSVKNLNALLEHDQLKFYFDPMGGGYCFKGPEELVKKWFCPLKHYRAVRQEGYSQVADVRSMGAVFLKYVQNRYKQTFALARSNDMIKILATQAREENAFRQWIVSKPWDGVPRFEQVCCSLQTSPGHEEHTELYQSYIRRSLLSMVALHFWQKEAPKIPAMLVLIGPEHTYKSTWAEWLIPEEMKKYWASARVEDMSGGGTEWNRYLSTKAIVVIDECEPLFSPKFEQKIKSSVDSSTVTFRDLYSAAQQTRPKTALIIGTTNKYSLYTGDRGTRKIWQIYVNQCDSQLLYDMDRQQLYAEIYAQLSEYKKENPKALIQSMWALTAEDRETINKVNTMNTRQDIGIIGMLNELFGRYTDVGFDYRRYASPHAAKASIRPGQPYNPRDNDPNCWTMSAVTKLLRAEYPEERIARNDVGYALEQYASWYTSTTQTSTHLFPGRSAYPSVYVNRGQIDYKGKSHYLMPPLRGDDEAVGEEDEEEEGDKSETAEDVLSDIKALQGDE